MLKLTNMWKLLDSGLYSLEFPTQRETLSSFPLPKPNGKIGLFSLTPENMITRETRGIKVYKGYDLEGYRASIVFYPTTVSVFVLSPFGSENFTIKKVVENIYEVKNFSKSANKEWICGCGRKERCVQRKGVGRSDSLKLTDFHIGGSVISYRLVFGLSQAGWATYEQLVHVVSVVNLIWTENFSSKFTLDEQDQLNILNSGQTFADSDINNFTGQFDDIIGNGSYDLGHGIGPGSGGLAYLGALGINNIKGGGWTSAPTITNDQLFIIDYLCHEMGHQLGCGHTFSKNYSDEGTSIAQVEPGSGSTIMGYAGITNVDIQYHSDSYFAAVSVFQAAQHRYSIPNVGTLVSNGDTFPQIKSNLTGHSIPPETAFELSVYPNDQSSIPQEVVSYSWCGVGTDPIYRTRETKLNYREFPRYGTDQIGTGYRGDNVFIPANTGSSIISYTITHIRLVHGYSGGSPGCVWNGSLESTSFLFTSTGGGSNQTVTLSNPITIVGDYNFIWTLNYTGQTDNDWASDLVVEFLDNQGTIHLSVGGYEYNHSGSVMYWPSVMDNKDSFENESVTISYESLLNSTDKVFRLTMKDHGQTSTTIHSKALYSISVGTGIKPEISNVSISEVGMSLVWNKSDTLSEYNADRVHIWISEPGKQSVSTGQFSEEYIYTYDYSNKSRMVYDGPNNGTSGLIPWSQLVTEYSNLNKPFKLKIKFYNSSDFLVDQKYKLFILRSEELLSHLDIYSPQTQTTITGWNCTDALSALHDNTISSNTKYFLDWNRSGDITDADSGLLLSHIVGNISEPPTGTLFFAGTIYSENGIWKGLNGNGQIYTFSNLALEFQIENLKVHSICIVYKTDTTIQVEKMVNS